MYILILYITKPIYIYIYIDKYIFIYAGNNNIKLTIFIHEVSWNELYISTDIYIYIYASISETI